MTFKNVPVPRKLGKPLIVGGVELAKLFEISASRIQQLVKAGVIKRRGKREYVLQDCVRDYIRFIRETQRSKQVNVAENRIREARARDIEARTAERLRRLVSLTVFDEMIDGFAGVVRSELAGMPAACTRDLIMRRIIERELNARLRRMAEYAKTQSIRLGAMGSAHDTERANGAGSMGGSESDLPTDSGDSGSA